MDYSAGHTLLTGASKGIGKAICHDLLDRGAKVIALSRSELDYHHPSLTQVPVDLADRQKTKKAARELADRYSILRVVHNAGAIRPALLEEARAEDLDYLSELHLGSMLTLVQAVLPGMKAAGFGRIVAISSRGALGLQTRTNYAATKAGMFGMIRTWALELGSFGITSNCVAPGPVETDMFYDIVDQEDQKRRIIDSIPVKRLGQGEDVAFMTAAFLAPEAGFITGQVVFVCGGTSIGSLTL